MYLEWIWQLLWNSFQVDCTVTKAAEKITVRVNNITHLRENAVVTGEQFNNRESIAVYNALDWWWGSLWMYTCTHLMWRERLEVSSLNLKGILMEAMEASSMRGFPAMHVARMSSCSLCRSIRSVICPGRLLPIGDGPPKSVGKARGRWLRLWISCNRSLHLGGGEMEAENWGEKDLDMRWRCMQHNHWW